MLYLFSLPVEAVTCLRICGVPAFKASDRGTCPGLFIAAHSPHPTPLSLPQSHDDDDDGVGLVRPLLKDATVYCLSVYPPEDYKEAT